MISASWTVVLLGAAVLTLTIGCGGGGGGGSSQITTGTVIGRALSGSTVLPIANFTATTDTNQSVTVSNSATGVFVIENVQAGLRTVTVSAQGFLAKTSAPQTLLAGSSTDFGDIRLDRNVPTPPQPPTL